MDGPSAFVASVPDSQERLEVGALLTLLTEFKLRSSLARLSGLESGPYCASYHFPLSDVSRRPIELADHKQDDLRHLVLGISA